MENVSSSATPKQTLALAISGYGGYENSPLRRDADGKIRHHLQQKIRALLKTLEAVPRAALPEDQARLSELFKSTRRKLGTIYQSLATPTYLDGGFFSKERVAARRLERVYEFEQAMLNEVENLALELNAMASHPLEKALIQEHVLHVQDCIDSFNQSLFEREALLIDEEYMV
jgi:hypothetical protein